MCCPRGLDSASGGVRAIHSLAPCAFRSRANAESLRPPVVPRACRPLQPDALCQRHGRRDVAEGAKPVRGAGGLLRGGVLRRGAAGREHRGRALGAARHLRPGVCDAGCARDRRAGAVWVLVTGNQSRPHSAVPPPIAGNAAAVCRPGRREAKDSASTSHEPPLRSRVCFRSLLIRSLNRLKVLMRVARHSIGLGSRHGSAGAP